MLLAAAGCNKQTGTGKDARPSNPSKVKVDLDRPEQPAGPAATVAPVKPPYAGQTQAPPAAPPKVETPPPPATVPKVILTKRQMESCLLNVGDALPDAALADLQGAAVPVGNLLGKRLTVVLFWNGAAAQLAANALDDLGRDVFQPLASQGVAVAAVNVGDPPQTVAQTAGQVRPQFPVLLDPQGAYFARLAKDGLPRVYLLDAAGKIAWFDLEFSRTTRRNLLQAIQAMLAAQ
jgi:peroxiredoxin